MPVTYMHSMANYWFSAVKLKEHVNSESVTKLTVSLWSLPLANNHQLSARRNETDKNCFISVSFRQSSVQKKNWNTLSWYYIFYVWPTLWCG